MFIGILSGTQETIKVAKKNLDYFKREQSIYYDWTNEDHFNLMNMSELPSFQNPGFKELGVTPHEILPTVHETCASYLVSFARE